MKSLLLVLVGLSTLWPDCDARADGCFVVPPFVWNRVTDINEPTQKAILLHDGGREDMILQVRYEGPVSQFGWLIPVPSQPEIGSASMASFYELSRFTQEYIYRQLQWSRPAFAGSRDSLNSSPPVNVIEYRTVGAYDVAVLATESADSLAEWLLRNHFALRQGSQPILRSYLEKHWFIVAVRVHLQQKEEQAQNGGLSRPSTEESPEPDFPSNIQPGELHPIKISFNTPECVFPLKISSLNGRASEVLLYVLSREPLMRPGLVKARHDREPGDPKQDLPVELEPVFPVGVVDANRLKKCCYDLPRLAGGKWAFVKFQRLLRPSEMEDLTFQSMLPVIQSNLEGRFSSEARNRMSYLEELGKPLWPMLACSMNVENRISCCTILRAYPSENSAELLLKLLNDPDLSVRFQATAAAELYRDPRVIAKLLLLLKDPDDEAIRTGAALSCGKLGVRDRQVIAALIELLDYPYATPCEEAQAALVKITGQKFKSKSDWRAWWVQNKADFQTQ